MPERSTDPPVEIHADQVRKTFGDRVVLDGVSATMHSGEIVGIVGASGSGKTVFLDHLIGLLRPDSGRILAADHDAHSGPDGVPQLVDITTLDEDRLDRIRLHWAVVFQRNALFSGTIRDNIALLLRERGKFSDEQIDQRTRQAIQAAQLDVNDVMDKDRDELSGGMAKRAAIARAIALDPLVIFYDEPTTGLDPVVSGHIHELIWRLHRIPVGSLFKDSGRAQALAGSDQAGTGQPARPSSPGKSSSKGPPATSGEQSSSMPVAEHPEPALVPESEPSESESLPSLPAAPHAGSASRCLCRTSIIITHDKELLRRIQPRIVMLDDGKVCFDGPYDKFGGSDCPPAQEYLKAMPVLHAGRRGRA
jgi:phospholipid/cholesterol/gamma-HCH transport system ATP-binding protein